MRRFRNAGPRMVPTALVLAASFGCGQFLAVEPVIRQAIAADEKVVVEGSSTVYRISRVAQESYSKARPGVTVVVNSQGTGGGFRNYLAGKTDVVDASRPATKDEQAKIDADPNLACTRFVVGYDGITVVVNPKNTFVKSLTVAQLKGLWEPDSKVKTWNDLDPAWPKRRIRLYSPDEASGTFEYFTEAVNGKAKLQRKDVQVNADDNFLVKGVSTDADALGYFGYAYYAANAKKLNAVAIQNGPDAKPVLPSPATILDKTYAPLSRPLFLYVKHSSLKGSSTGGFVAHYLENVAAFATKAMYVPPTADDLAANKKALEAATR